MRKMLCIPVLFLALSVGLTTPVRAAPPIEGSGTFTDSNVIVTPVRQADGNTFISVTFTEVDTGILTGWCLASFTEVIHSDGAGNFIGSQTCKGSVYSQAGTYIFSFVGTQVQAPFGPFHGQFVLSGTGTLSNLHGQGTFQAGGLSGIYTVAVHVDPCARELHR